MSQPPHLPHTASFSSSKSDLNKHHRQQVSAIIYANAVGLKSTLFKLFTKPNLGATIGPRNDKSTLVLFEGPFALVIRAQEALQTVLTDEYPGIEIAWDDLVESSGQLSIITLIEIVQLKRPPFSGDFKEAELDLSGGGLCRNCLSKKFC